MPASKGDVHSDKRTYDPEYLADLTATALIEGKGQALRRNPRLGPVTEEDRVMMQRVTGETVEQFNSRLSEKLRTIADKTASRIEEKLDKDQFKTSELGFILTVAEDKRTRLDGTQQLHGSSVNIQVNNFGPSSKDALLDQLDGRIKQALKAIT